MDVKFAGSYNSNFHSGNKRPIEHQGNQGRINKKKFDAGNEENPGKKSGPKVTKFVRTEYLDEDNKSTDEKISSKSKSWHKSNNEVNKKPEKGSEAAGPDQELITFLTRMNESLLRKKESELKVEISDLLSTIEGDEVKVIEDVRTNPIIRRVIQKCEIDQLSCFVNIFTDEENLQFIIEGSECCAFLEKCFALLVEKIGAENKRLSDFADLKNAVFIIVDFIVGQSGNEILCDLKMIHLVKKLIFLLAEIYEGDGKRNANFGKPGTPGPVKEKKEMPPEDQKDGLQKVATWLKDCEDVDKMLASASCCSLLVSLFNALGSIKSLKLVSEIFRKLFPNQATESFKDFCMDKQTNVVVEAAIRNSSKILFSTIFQLVSPFIAEMSKHSAGNFVVQQLLLRCRVTSVSSELFNSLKDHLLDIMESGNFNVFNNLLHLCTRYPSLQSEMYSKMLELFQCTNGKSNIFVLLSYYVTSKEYESKDTRSFAFKPAAAVSVQHMFNWESEPLELWLHEFSKCESKFFIKACCDKNMSYAIEAFFRSQTISDESKQKILLQKILPNLKTIAMNNCGSFLVESMVKNSDTDAKHKIMDALVLHKDELQKSHSGFIITQKLWLSLYESRKSQWAIRLHSK